MAMRLPSLEFVDLHGGLADLAANDEVLIHGPHGRLAVSSVRQVLPPLDLDLSPLPDAAVVYDLVYAPLQTGLLKAAAARGLDTVDGLDMLIGQAALAFELFFGQSPPEGRDDELRALLTA